MAGKGHRWEESIQKLLFPNPHLPPLPPNPPSVLVLMEMGAPLTSPGGGGGRGGVGLFLLSNL